MRKSNRGFRPRYNQEFCTKIKQLREDNYTVMSIAKHYNMHPKTIKRIADETYVTIEQYEAENEA